MSERLADRHAVLTIAAPLVSTGFFADLIPNATVIRDLRIAFSITKTLESTPNKCEIKVYNLSDTSRAALQTKPLHILLEAGYETRLNRLFAGDLTWVHSKRDGALWETAIEVGDGDRAFVDARISKSYKAGIDLKTLVGDAAKTMGFEIPKDVASAKAFAGQLLNGATLHGPSREQMTKLLGSQGYGWSVQNERLQILKNGAYTDESAWLVTGMVGSPEYAPPKEPGKQPTLTVRMLLYPELTPGGRIKLESQSVNGVFRISKVTHTGDTRGPDWYTDVEATPT